MKQISGKESSEIHSILCIESSEIHSNCIDEQIQTSITRSHIRNDASKNGINQYSSSESCITIPQFNEQKKKKIQNIK